MTPDRDFLFLLGSARTGGNTEMLARRAAAALPASTATRWLDLRDHPLPDFVDRRHDGTPHPAPERAERVLLDATLAATDLVIVSPLYWYSVSADVKRYLDHWSGWMRLPGVRFKARMAGKTLWGVTVLGDDDVRVTEPLFGTLRLSAEYLGMNWAGVLTGNGSAPGDVLADGCALDSADTFFERNATVATSEAKGAVNGGSTGGS